MAAENTVLVVAIDFGTSGSGYAFSFRHEYTSNPLTISTYTWGGSAYKTPSSILFKPDQKFHSFGDEAEDKYRELSEQENTKDWFFLQGFKMQLYKAVENGEDVREDFSMKDINGKKISGKLVVAHSIGYLRQHMMDQLVQRNTGVPEEYIFWVLTVPAIWNDACKQFMREAAEKSGISMDRFSLVYEPEAASIFAKSLPLDRIVGDDNRFALKTFDIGRKFIVVDGGGGTVDISAQQVAENGDLNTIHRACGGPYGGEFINQEFRKILSRVCGGDVLREFREKHIEDYLDVMKSFEIKKKTFVGGNIVVKLPTTLSDILSETTGCSLEDLIQNGSLRDDLKVKRDKLFIDERMFRGFFSQSIKCIVEEIKNVLENPRCAGTSTIMLVGGLSESDIIRSGLQQAYPDKQLFIPLEGGLAVLKGAVLYGQNPTVVTSRTCSHTYGVAVMEPFKQGVHDIQKRIIINEEEFCDDIFHKVYTINEQIEVEEKRSISLTYQYEEADDQDKRKQDNAVEIFVSDKINPMYVTEEGSRLYAIISVPPPGGLWSRVSHGRLELQIAGTEIVATYIDRTTGARTTTKCGFLPKQGNSRNRLCDPDNVLQLADDI